MNINKQLEDLYSTQLSYTRPEQCPPGHPFETQAFPFLLYVDDEKAFEDKSTVKVMFFGQELSCGASDGKGIGWYGYDYQKPVGENMKLYSKFFNSETGSDNKKGLGGGMNALIEMIRKKFPQKPFRFVWNNVVKLATSGVDAKISQEYYDVVGKDFSRNIIKGELEIIKPDIIIFLSGYEYDDKLKDIFGNVSFETLPNYKREKTGNCERTTEKWGDFTEKELVKMNLPEFPFVKYAFRTYHPNYKKNSYYDRFYTIRDEIKL
jgi:hypothetical protein